jgi:hypothetical protein
MHRDHLAAFGEFAKACCIRQANEFELDDGAGNFERFGHGGSQRLRIGQIFDDEIFAVIEIETVRSRRIGRIIERHRECTGPNIGYFHGKAPAGVQTRQRPKSSAAR